MTEVSIKAMIYGGILILASFFPFQAMIAGCAMALIGALLLVYSMVVSEP